MYVYHGEYSKNYWIIHFKTVNFMLCEYYLKLW
jgi:hypothetical protein